MMSMSRSAAFLVLGCEFFSAYTLFVGFRSAACSLNFLVFCGAVVSLASCLVVWSELAGFFDSGAIEGKDADSSFFADFGGVASLAS